MFVISLYEKAASKTTSMWPYCHTTYQDKHSLSVNAVKIYCCHQQHCYMDSLWGPDLHCRVYLNNAVSPQVQEKQYSTGDNAVVQKSVLP